jgi:hypothetical protein
MLLLLLLLLGAPAGQLVVVQLVFPKVLREPEKRGKCVRQTAASRCTPSAAGVRVAHCCILWLI